MFSTTNRREFLTRSAGGVATLAAGSELRPSVSWTCVRPDIFLPYRYTHAYNGGRIVDAVSDSTL